ncbi:MAG: hypothetical protein WC450_07705 [Candidatus Omnitrophota bacterium]|jgi:hypothetical protein
MIIFILTGCGTVKQTERRAKVAAREASFDALNTAVMSGELKTGMSGQEISARFGEPDDMYRSISQMSVTEIWTYKRDPNNSYTSQWRPIRMTFENHKLLNISY